MNEVSYVCAIADIPYSIYSKIMQRTLKGHETHLESVFINFENYTEVGVERHLT